MARDEVLSHQASSPANHQTSRQWRRSVATSVCLHLIAVSLLLWIHVPAGSGISRGQESGAGPLRIQIRLSSSRVHSRETRWTPSRQATDDQLAAFFQRTFDGDAARSRHSPIDSATDDDVTVDHATDDDVTDDDGTSSVQGPRNPRDNVRNPRDNVRLADSGASRRSNSMSPGGSRYTGGSMSPGSWSAHRPEQHTHRQSASAADVGDRPSLGTGGDAANDDPNACSFFGLPAIGKRIVYVVDRSGSMRGRRFDLAVAELKKSIAGLDHDQRFQIMFFSNTTIQLVTRDRRDPWASAMQPDFPFIQSQLDAITVDGGTDPRDAVRRAIAAGADTLFLLSDGEFDETLPDDEFEGRSISDLLLQSTRRPRVHAIALHDRDSLTAMRDLARITSGRYRFVPADVAK
ncbi:MAG: hypothetical protein AAF958_11380 [Planctomycetota bacterium]